MNRKIIVAIVVLGLSGISGCYGSDKTGHKADQVVSPVQNVAISAKNVDANSRENLGVGLSAISMLFQSGANSYLLQDALDPTELQGIHELETAGYIVKQDKTSGQDKYIVLIPTSKGIELMSALGWREGGAQ